MKIKLAILEKDQSYLNRIVAAFNTRYADKFEIYSFTDFSIALPALEDSRIDVLVASDVFDIDTSLLPRRCGFAYFVDTPGIDILNDKYAICKFQKAELIYKRILSIYSENVGNISGIQINDEGTKVIIFSSPCGGAGTSTMAVACAVNYAAQKKKTLYLNLEKFGSADVNFTAEGQFDMSDIIFALKSKKTNLSLKLESCVKQDKRGVYFYSQPKLALDMLELGEDEIVRLISELKITGLYDYIVIDMDFAINDKTLDVYRQSHALVFVSDGSEISNIKTFRAYKALMVKEQNKDLSVTNRMSLIYNKFSNKTSKGIENLEIKSVGGAPRYEQASAEQIIKELAKMDIFNKIL